eukprot:TRINITY_DN1940_c0_g1_i1.p1 TRINITY_DN1940_c0_g1~~TRINITY_DN1940_c0_g1_i1.p1  ORF type:complete len:107 (-),score=35.27 TRINITY_DN1940_c0_g1_i1:11-331(-)
MCIRDSYHSFLRQLRLSDSELRNFGNQWLPEIVNIAYSFVMALVYFLFALPGLLLTYPIGLITVSYTHLTLPTIYSVQISVVAVSLKKKNINIYAYSVVLLSLMFL